MEENKIKFQKNFCCICLKVNLNRSTSREFVLEQKNCGARLTQDMGVAILVIITFSN